MQKTDAGVLLAAHRIRPSHQRVRILQYLQGTRSHPTCEEIYAALVGEMPTLSRTTVYNTVELFARAQVLQELFVDGNGMRYDADTSLHGHFLCERCGRVTDFDVNGLSVSGLEGYAVEAERVVFRGICPSCQSESREREAKQ